MAHVEWEVSKEGGTYRVLRQSIGKIGRIEIRTLPRGNYHDLGGDPPGWVEMESYVNVLREDGGQVPYATRTKVYQLAAESLQDKILNASFEESAPPKKAFGDFVMQTKIAKRYGTASGNRFARVVAKKGSFLMDVKTRDGRGGSDETRSKETKRLAYDRAIAEGIFEGTSPSAPKKAPKKAPTRPKKAPTRPNCRTPASRARPNRFTVRTETVNYGWRGEVYDLTLAEAKKEANQLSRDGYIAAVYEGRRVVYRAKNGD